MPDASIRLVKGIPSPVGKCVEHGDFIAVTGERNASGLPIAVPIKSKEVSKLEQVSFEEYLKPITPVIEQWAKEVSKNPHEQFPIFARESPDSFTYETLVETGRSLAQLAYELETRANLLHEQMKMSVQAARTRILRDAIEKTRNTYQKA